MEVLAHPGAQERLGRLLLQLAGSELKGAYQMKRIPAISLSLALLVLTLSAQSTPQSQQKVEPEDVIRISTELVQTDVVVTDKNDQPVPDLKLGDFELYDNGKKQDVKFLEFVSVATGRRSEGKRPAPIPNLGTDLSRNPAATELKRVIAFVVDDLTIPTEDLFRARQMLSDYVDNQMRPGDLVAIIRTIDGKGLLQQFTSDRQLLRRAIAMLTPRSSPFNAFDNPDQDKIRERPTPAGGSEGDAGSVAEGPGSAIDIESVSDDTNRTLRAMMALSASNFVIDSLKQIPGHKSLVLISGGLPLIEISQNGGVMGNISFLVNQLVKQDRCLRRMSLGRVPERLPHVHDG